MKHFIYIIFVITGLSLSGQESMTLPKAISIGLENNFDVKISDKLIQIAENNNTWARAGRVPTIDLGGSFNNTRTQDNNPASFIQGTFYNGSAAANISANYLLYAGGRVKILKDQLSLGVSQERLNQESAIHDLIRVIYQQYYNVIFQKERYDVLLSAYDLSRERLAYEKLKSEYGATNSFNLIQFENALLSDSTNLISQDQAIQIAERQLYNTLEVPADSRYTFDEKLSVTDEEIDADQLKQVMSEENYTIKSLDMIASLNRLNTKLAQAARKPTISANTQLSFAENGFQIFAENPNTGDPFPFLFSNRLQATVGINASWNVYDGGVLSANEQNALIREDIDRISREQAAANLSDQLDILLENYSNQKEILALTGEQLQLSQRNLDISTERFKGGQITSIDLRNIQLQTLNASFSKVNAIYNLILTKSEIDYLVGIYEDN